MTSVQRTMHNAEFYSLEAIKTVTVMGKLEVLYEACSRQLLSPCMHVPKKGSRVDPSQQQEISVTTLYEYGGCRLQSQAFRITSKSMKSLTTVNMDFDIIGRLAIFCYTPPTTGMRSWRNKESPGRFRQGPRLSWLGWMQLIPRSIFDRDQKEAIPTITSESAVTGQARSIVD